MHHSLKLYSRYREFCLKYHIFQARWTRIPFIGKIVRKVANLYGKKASAAYLLTPQEADMIVDGSDEVALGACTCRTVFKNCKNPTNTEIMVGLGKDIFTKERPNEYQTITKEVAKEILKQCHLKGLIHTIIKCHHDFYAICNCCPCCCVPFRLNKEYGIGNALARKSNIVEEFKRRQLFHR